MSSIYGSNVQRNTNQLSVLAASGASAHIFMNKELGMLIYDLWRIRVTVAKAACNLALDENAVKIGQLRHINNRCDHAV